MENLFSSWTPEYRNLLLAGPKLGEPGILTDQAAPTLLLVPLEPLAASLHCGASHIQSYLALQASGLCQISLFLRHKKLLLSEVLLHMRCMSSPPSHKWSCIHSNKKLSWLYNVPETTDSSKLWSLILWTDEDKLLATAESQVKKNLKMSQTVKDKWNFGEEERAWDAVS
jgi:hypothetical protein